MLNRKKLPLLRLVGENTASFEFVRPAVQFQGTSRCCCGHTGVRAQAFDLYQDVFFDGGRQPVFFILDVAVVIFDDPGRSRARGSARP